MRNIKNRVEYGIKSLGNRIKEYAEAASKYVVNTGNKIREKVETAKYVILNTLMNTLIFSNSYGRMGYYSAKAYISYKIAKQAEKGKIYYGRSNIIVPIIAGSIGGALGFFAAMWLGDFSGLNHQYQELQQELQNLQNQYQSVEQQLQNINTLTDVLFGKGNSNDISVIQINSVQIENGTAYIQGTVGFTGNNVTLEIPIGYAENNNVNIQEFVSVVQQYQQNGWNPYISIDRADLQYMNLLNNQNGTYVISIQPNEPINIGVMASTANSSTLDSVLNNLGHYTMLIQDGNQGNYAVYGDPNAFYGYLPSVTSSTGGTVVINFPAGSQYYSQAETMINIADQIINSPGNQNPTSSGYIDTYDIFSVNSTGAYQGFPEYNVGQTYIPLIVLQSGQGNTIISDVSS
jgi:hypothetical protein